MHVTFEHPCHPSCSPTLKVKLKFKTTFGVNKGIRFVSRWNLHASYDRLYPPIVYDWLERRAAQTRFTCMILKLATQLDLCFEVSYSKSLFLDRFTSFYQLEATDPSRLSSHTTNTNRKSLTMHLTSLAIKLVTTKHHQSYRLLSYK